MTPVEKNALRPHIVTALLTLLIQALGAVYVYGQMTATVVAHTEAIKALQRDKLDCTVYYREHPSAPTGGQR